MHLYEHRQLGTLTLVALGGGVVMTVAITAMIAAAASAAAIIAGATAIILIACMVLFGSLTVTVTREQVMLWFGPGVIRKRFPVRDIDDARAVRNRWYYGWGIHLTPHGWLFNVSGMDAVEIQLQNGRRYRIGTDEPRELLAAIQQARGIAG